MIETGNRTAKLLLIAGAIVLAGCAAPRTPVTQDDGFPAEAATETFAAGYSNIVLKYIDPVRLDDLAVEGMRGLGVIDPALTVRRQDGELVLASADGDVAHFTLPADKSDAQAWAGLTVAVSRTARTVSPEMDHADIEDIYQAVFDSALSHLDRYSRYAGREEAKRHRDRREGFGGIGVRFQAMEDGAHITEIVEESPAEKVGLRPGDILIQVNGKPVRGLSSKQVSHLLRGAIDTSVLLTVRRGDGGTSLLTYRLKRAHVVPNTVTAEFESGILILRVNRFNQATSAAIRRKVREAERVYGDSLEGLVLDLRGNPGGLLKQAIYAADLFLTQGEILRTRGRHPDSEQYYEAGGADLLPGLPLVVLVDGKSASAAEITAAAIQDRGRGLVIGTTSYGKGTVQTVIPLPNDGEITLTWSRFITPSGYVLHELGVHPTLCTSAAVPGHGDPVAYLLARRPQAAAVIADWRTVPFTDNARKKLLRADCPAERHPDSPDELSLARRLIEDSALYSRLLGLSNMAAADARS